MNPYHSDSKSYRSEVATIGATSENLALFAYYGSGGITLMRNALGVAQGGSGVPLDPDAYRRSVAFWQQHANWRSG